MKGENNRLGNTLIDTDLREIGNLKEVGHNFDLLSQFSKISTLFEAIDLEASEFVGNMRSHGDERI